MKQLSALAILVGVFAMVSSVSAQWISMNGTFIAEVHCITEFNDQLYAGTTAGVSVSIDNGITWEPANGALPPETTVFAMETTPSSISPQRLYIGTSTGVFSTTDNGTTWTPRNNGLPLDPCLYSFIFDICIVPDSAGGMVILAGTVHGVYTSYNQGDSWSRFDFQYEAHTLIYPIIAVERPGLNPYILCGTTWFSYVIRSSDYGLTWESPESVPDTYGYYAMLNTGSRIYAGTNLGIIASSDTGKTWSILGTGIPEGTIVGALAAGSTPQASHVLYAGTDFGFYVSTDDGATWMLDESGIPKTTDVNTLYVSQDGKYLFAGTQKFGIYRFEFASGTWTQISNGLPESEYEKKYIHSFSQIGGDLIAGMYIEKILRTTDRGRSWKESNEGLPDVVDFVYAQVVADDNGRSVLFAGTKRRGVFRSLDSGYTWEAVNTGIPFNVPVNALFEYNGNIYAGANTVYISSDMGDTWEKSPPPIAESTTVNCFLDAGRYLYCGLHYSGVFRSSTNGTSWEPASSGALSSESVHSLLQFYDLRGNAHIVAGTGDGVYFSADDAQTWTYSDSGLYNYHVINSLVMHPFPGGGMNIFAGTSNGIYRSTDGAKSWVYAGEGIYNDANCYTLFVHDSMIYAGTNVGAYKRPLSEVVVSAAQPPAPASLALGQNYPNPVAFGATATIPYTLERRGYVSLKVYNALGRLVATLVDATAESGAHRAQLVAANLSPGIYFYRLHSDGAVMERKMVVMR